MCFLIAKITWHIEHMSCNLIYYTSRYFEIVILVSSNYSSLSLSASYKKPSKSSSVKILRFWYVIFCKGFFNAKVKNLSYLFETLFRKISYIITKLFSIIRIFSEKLTIQLSHFLTKSFVLRLSLK